MPAELLHVGRNLQLLPPPQRVPDRHQNMGGKNSGIRALLRRRPEQAD